MSETCETFDRNRSHGEIPEDRIYMELNVYLSISVLIKRRVKNRMTDTVVDD